MSFLTVVPAIGFALLVASSYINKVKGAIDYVTDGIRRTRGLSAAPKSTTSSPINGEIPLEMVTTSSSANSAAAGGKVPLPLPLSAMSAPSVAFDNDNGRFTEWIIAFFCISFVTTSI
jgi:hypothetical protein